jgi:hypothetical protein
MKYLNKILYILSFCVVLSFVSCDKILEVDLPSNIVSQEEVFEDPVTIKLAVTGLYEHNFLETNSIYSDVLVRLLSIAADESYHNQPNLPNYVELTSNTYGPANSYIAYLWTLPYESILLSNDLISHLLETAVISEVEKRHYIGEAKYFRAYDYFILVNIFGDVPWVISSNVFETELLPRESKEKIITEKDGIIDDLKYAKTALATSNNPRTRVTKASASALLARVYLYHRDWEDAEREANEVITTSGYKLETNLENVFLRTSKETILSVSSSGSSPSYVDRTSMGMYMLNVSFFRLTDELVNSFEDNDLRKEKWLKDEGAYFHCWKYKRNKTSAAGAAEDLVLLRLSEQYLIRAEARAQQNKLTGVNGAIADLDTIRHRAGLDYLPQTLSKEEVLLAIENERRHELFLEEGHRWWDLVRTGRADAVLGSFPGKQWASYKALFPIPIDELIRNRKLTPNPGYGEVN